MKFITLKDNQFSLKSRSGRHNNDSFKLKNKTAVIKHTGNRGQKKCYAKKKDTEYQMCVWTFFPRQSLTQNKVFISFSLRGEMKLPVDLHRLFAKLACWADWNRHRISVKLQCLRVADNQNQAYVILQTMVCLSNEMEKTKIQLQ